MKKGFKNIEVAKNENRQWIIRLAKLLNDREMSRKDLAEKAVIAASTVSNWFTQNGEPSLTNIKKITDALNISPNYFFGNHDCTSPKYNFIQKETGLTEEAIKKLRSLKKRAERNVSQKKKLQVISLLIEHENGYEIEEGVQSDFLAHLQQYLTDEFIVSAKEVSGDGGKIGLFNPLNEFEIDKDFIERVMLSDIQKDIMVLKRKIAKNKIEELRFR